VASSELGLRMGLGHCHEGVTEAMAAIESAGYRLLFLTARQPSTLNPQPSTLLNPQPSTLLNPQPSTLNIKSAGYRLLFLTARWLSMRHTYTSARARTHTHTHTHTHARARTHTYTHTLLGQLVGISSIVL